MRNSNGAKYIVILSLLVSVVALSVGFAALTSTLTIKSSATVSNNQGFSVVLSTSTTASNQGTVTPTVSPSTGGPTGDAATLTPTQISGIKANFTGVGQTVTYTFAARNTGQFIGYLNSINFGSKTCTAGTGTTQSYVDAACNGITLTVKVGSGSTLVTKTATDTNISSHSLAVNAGEQIVVEVNYASNASLADGDFTVAFGDITITYGSVD